MSSLYRTFKTDADVEKQGIFVDYGEARFLIARAGGANSAFRKLFQAKTKPYRRQIDTDTLSEEVGRKLLAEAYAEAVILRVDTAELDAEGEPVLENGEKKWTLNRVPLEDGSTAEATNDNVTALLLNLPELFSDLQDQASKAANFRAIEAEADEGNSEQS